MLADHAVGDEGVDVGVAIAEFAEQVAGVFAEHRHAGARAPGLVVDPVAVGGDVDFADRCVERFGDAAGGGLAGGRLARL